MNAIEQEIAKLRQRVARLEALVQGTGQAAHPAPMVPATKPAALAPQATKTHRSLPDLPASVWIAGAGALIFLIGVIYGLTVSIERGWISPGVRVLAGIGTGLALGAVAARNLLGSNRTLGVALLLAGTGTWTFALYYGAQTAQLFPLALGFAGTALATFFAGALGARSRSDGALAVAIASGLVAPLAFADSTGRLSALLAFLLLLTAAQLAANYFTGTGGAWRWSRVLGVSGSWCVALVAPVAAQSVATPGLDLWLAALLGVAILALAWLPGHPETPWLPGAATVTSQLALGLYSWSRWRHSGYAHEDFSWILIALAATTLLLVAVARRRSGSERYDTLLVPLTLAFAMAAMPLRLDWDQIAMAWGACAALLAWAARSATMVWPRSAPALKLAAGLASTAATMVWSGLVSRQDGSATIFFNSVFCGGLLSALAWYLQALTPGSSRPIAFVALQLVAGPLLAQELARAVPGIEIGGAELALGPLLATLVYALSGSAQWLWGLNGQTAPGQAQALRWAGYGWLAAAAAKLLLHDMADADLLFRAVTALGVGAIFIATALWASRAPRQRAASACNTDVARGTFAPIAREPEALSRAVQSAAPDA